MQPVRRSSSERSTIQYVDEEAPTPRRIARGSLAAGRAKKEKEAATVRVDVASIQPLLERAKSCTTEVRPLFDRTEHTTRKLEYSGITLPRDPIELSATDVQVAAAKPAPAPRRTLPRGFSVPAAVSPFAAGPEGTAFDELSYDLLALIAPPRAATRMQRVEEPIAPEVSDGDASEPSIVIELVDRIPKRPAIYPIEPVKMAPMPPAVTVRPLVTARVRVPTIGKTLLSVRRRRRWVAKVALLVLIATVAFAATIAAVQLGLVSTTTAPARMDSDPRSTPVATPIIELAHETR